MKNLIQLLTNAIKHCFKIPGWCRYITTKPVQYLYALFPLVSLLSKDQWYHKFDFTWRLSSAIPLIQRGEEIRNNDFANCILIRIKKFCTIFAHEFLNFLIGTKRFLANILIWKPSFLYLKGLCSTAIHFKHFTLRFSGFVGDNS